MKSLLLSLLAFSLIGCDLLGISTSTHLSLKAEHSTYRPGQTVVLTLVNGTDRTIFVHPYLCGAVLERWSEAAWQPEDDGGVCTGIVYELRPGKKVTGRQVLSSELPAGTYRYRYGVYEEGVYTDGFEVEP